MARKQVTKDMTPAPEGPLGTLSSCSMKVLEGQLPTSDTKEPDLSQGDMQKSMTSSANGLNETAVADGSALVEPMQASPPAPLCETSTMVDATPTKQLLHPGGTQAILPTLMARANAANIAQSLGMTKAHRDRHAAVVKTLMGQR